MATTAFSGVFSLMHSEKIEYRPAPVREVLTEMKDLSEIMIDLAYSAALFHSRELAEEVLELEKRVDYLAYMLDMNAMLAARDAEDAESLIGVTKVAAATDKISDAAADIAAIVLQEIGVHPIVREAFQKVEEQLARVRVEAESVFIKRTLRELELAAKIGVDIIAIRRGSEWVIDPDGEEKILEEDVLIARGPPIGIDEVMKLAKGTSRELD